MKISQRGVDLISQFEGLSLVAYLDTGGVWTIGYGHTHGVKKGDTCTKEQAIEWLRADCHDAECFVRNLVEVSLNQNQFDALVCFTFNVGGGALRDSTLLKLLNHLDYTGAAQQFVRWNKDNGRSLVGLTKRRLAEADLFTEEA